MIMQTDVEYKFISGPANDDTAEKLSVLGSQGWHLNFVTVAFGGFVFTLERTKNS